MCHLVDFHTSHYKCFLCLLKVIVEFIPVSKQILIEQDRWILGKWIRFSEFIMYLARTPWQRSTCTLSVYIGKISESLFSSMEGQKSHLCKLYCLLWEKMISRLWKPCANFKVVRMYFTYLLYILYIIVHVYSRIQFFASVQQKMCINLVLRWWTQTFAASGVNSHLK